MKPVEQTVAFARMTEAGIPPQRAAVKVKSTRRGVVFFLLGLLCIAGGFAFVVWVMKETKASPSVALLIFAALPALPGAYFLLAGGHLIAGDAMMAAEESGGVIARTAARALRVVRPKDGS